MPLRSAPVGCLALGAIGVLALLVALYGVIQYNALVTLEEKIDGAWAQVGNVLQRRADLIPNLVETVKGYAAHEREIFEEVADARSRLAGAAGPAEAAAADAGLRSVLGRLLAIAEAYPDLKASANFVRLQDELAGSENRIANERRTYNEMVRLYNTALRVFPTRILAGAFGFKEREYFEAAPGTEAPPRVDFTGSGKEGPR
jgi:LemA protein